MARKRIKAKDFEGKYVRFLEQGGDKEFFRAAFELEGDYYVLRAMDDKKDSKRVAALFKAIKGNRALPVKVVPLAIFAAVVVALGIFVLVFLNPFLENLTERGLENVFEARVDISGFNLSLIRFNVSIESMSVANRDEPMSNLIEMGKTGVRLRPQAVLRGKVYIEEIRADSLRFGTPRKVSGALPGLAAKKAESAAKAKKDAGPPLIDFQHFDAAALLEREYDKLQSVKMYEEARAFYDGRVESWTAKVEDVKGQAGTLEKSARTIIGFNVNSIDVKNPADIKRVLELVAEGKALLENVQKASSTATEMVNSVQADIKAADALRIAAQNSVSNDLARFRSYFDFSGGGYNQILDPILEEILSSEAQVYLSYGRRALEALDKVKALSAKLPAKTEGEKKAALPAFKGRDVIYPSRQYPKFFLGILASDFEAGGAHWGFDLRDVSSDPEITAKPVSLKVDFSETDGAKRYINFAGEADMRSSANELFEAKIAGGNIAVNFEQGLEELGIAGFTGNADLTIEAAGGRDGSVRAGAESKLTRAALIKPEGTVATAVAMAVASVPSLDLGVLYTRAGATDDGIGESDFAITTNIGDLILASLKKIASEYAKQGIAMLEQELRARLLPVINESIVSQKDLDSLFALAKGDKAALATLQSSLQNKIGELETKARGQAEEKANELKEQAQQQAKDALGNALKGRLPF
ncbi:MAG: hypothetical protein LBT01_01765 [Spirochaetaceae bacterium]|jgi:uncharacterized protein (TIGR03545 family)|nr:hypothetical protein [Spirochaetaceae bacterium]